MALSHEIGVIGGGSQSTGESDHAALDNLDFPSSNHTGFAPEEHTHEIEDVSGLETALGDIESALGGKEPTLTKGDLTATSPIVLSQTRQVIGGAAVISLQAAYTPRERLLAARTYYVRTDGNDSNTGLVDSAAGAFLTIQAALDALSVLDLNGNAVTVKVGDGTYTGANTVNAPIGAGDIYIAGNSSTPASVLISTTSANAFYAQHGLLNVVHIKDLKIQTTTSGSGIYANNSAVRWSNIVFGACAGEHVIAVSGADVRCEGNYSIIGGANSHLYANMTSKLLMDGYTVTLTGTPVFGAAFAVCLFLSVLQATSITFSGSATGSRYYAALNGCIFTGGGGANYFPGNAAGSTATGGQYL